MGLSSRCKADGMADQSQYDEISDAYGRIADRDPSKYCIQFPWARRQLPTDIAGLRILDVGCGEGELTRSLAREGASVVVADYDASGGQAVADEIHETGMEALFAKTDVSDEAQVQDMVAAALKAFGRLDILFNSAGVLAKGSVLDTDLATWQRVMDINLTGTFLCGKAALPHMIAGGGGAIINMSSSTGAHDGNAGSAAYVASKGGVTLLTRCMAIDHAGDKVRVNAIAPGPTDTPMLRQFLDAEGRAAFAATFPMRRLGSPEEIAQTALFLASDEASFVTGAILCVDGGQTALV